MKNYSNIMTLFALPSIKKVFIIFLIQVVGNFIILTKYLQNAYTVMSIFEDNIIFSFNAILFLILIFVLCLGLGKGSDHHDYMLDRLTVNKKQIVTSHAIYNSICFITFWALLLIVLFVFIFLNINKPEFNGINVFSIGISFYRNAYLHSLLPISDIVVLTRNIVGIIMLSLFCTTPLYKHGLFSKCFYTVLFIYNLYCFPASVTSNNHVWLTIIISLFIIVNEISRLRKVGLYYVVEN